VACLFIVYSSLPARVRTGQGYVPDTFPLRAFPAPLLCTSTSANQHSTKGANFFACLTYSRFIKTFVPHRWQQLEYWLVRILGALTEFSEVRTGLRVASSLWGKARPALASLRRAHAQRRERWTQAWARTLPGSECWRMLL
jgi:hypothetical protein